MLKDEGTDEELVFDINPTWVLDEGEIKGFFTLTEDHGYPAVVYFCVHPAYRSMALARRLVKAMMYVAMRFGNKLILHSKKDYLDKCIEYYFKTKPYAVKDGYRFYLVDIGG